MKVRRLVAIAVLLFSIGALSASFAFQEGPFKGEKECFNYGKQKNCECDRACVDGQPQRDPTCKNHCFEDKCKCHTKCNT